MKFLIGSAHYGGGHDSLALILQNIINKSNGKHEATIHYLHGKKASISYRIMGPTSFFNKFWHKTDNLIGRELFLTLADTILYREIKQAVKTAKPDTVLIIHPFYDKSIIRLNKPFFIFVTDPFSVHAMWAELEAQKIIVFTKQAVNRLTKLFVPNDKIILSKFPLRDQFYEPKENYKIKQELNINPDKVVLVLGGNGEGMDRTKQTAIALHKTNLDFRAYIVCGRNLILKTTLSARLFNDPRFVVLGFTDKLAEYLSIADLFIGKVGANILFECLWTTTPIIATLPVLAQEEGNRDFIIKHKLGWVLDRPSEIIKLISELISDPKKLDSIKKRMLKTQNHYVCNKDEFSLLVKNILQI